MTICEQQWVIVLYFHNSCRHVDVHSVHSGHRGVHPWWRCWKMVSRRPQLIFYQQVGEKRKKESKVLMIQALAIWEVLVMDLHRLKKVKFLLGAKI